MIYQKSRKNLNSRFDVLLCFIVGILLQVPEMFAKDMKTEYCLVIWYNDSRPTCLDSGRNCPCFCPNDNFTDFFDLSNIHMEPGNRLCEYYGKDDLSIKNSIIWKSYKIICELITRFGPTLILIILNIAIIRNFNLSVERKKKLRANHFIQRSSSKLMDRPSKFFAPRAKKLSSAT